MRLESQFSFNEQLAILFLKQSIIQIKYLFTLAIICNWLNKISILTYFINMHMVKFACMQRDLLSQIYETKNGEQWAIFLRLSGSSPWFPIGTCQISRHLWLSESLWQCLQEYSLLITKLRCPQHKGYEQGQNASP